MLARSVVFWTASVEPVPLERSTAFLTAESSTTVGRVHRGVSDPLSSLFSRRQGSTLSLSVYRLSLRPSPNKNPAFLW